MWDAQVDERSGERKHSARVPMTVVQDGDTVELRLTRTRSSSPTRRRRTR